MWSRHCTLNIQRKCIHSRKWTLHLSCAVFFTIASIGWRHLLCNVWVVGTMATNTVVGNSWKSSTIYVSDVAVIKGLAMKRGFQPSGWHTLVNLSVCGRFTRYTNTALNQNSRWRLGRIWRDTRFKTCTSTSVARQCLRNRHEDNGRCWAMALKPRVEAG
jgi:hypothetical protein